MTITAEQIFERRTIKSVDYLIKQHHDGTPVPDEPHFEGGSTNEVVTTEFDESDFVVSALYWTAQRNCTH